MNVGQSVIKKLKNGDEGAFDEIYNAYSRLVFFIIQSIVQDYETAKDIMQDTFIEMYQNISTLRELKNFHSWLTSIARYKAIDYVRREKKRPFKEATMIENDWINDSAFLIQDFPRVLEEIETTIIMMHIVHNLTFKRISEKLGFTQNVVVKKYYCALKKLRLFFKERR